MNNKKDLEKYSKEELADLVFPSEKKEDPKERQAIQDLKKRMVGKTSPERQLLLNLLRIRYQMEDYLSDDQYDKKLSFGYFLKHYVQALGIKMKKMAYELGIQPTHLSQLINDKRKPKDEILIRLEIHSNQTIPALLWYRLLEKEQEHEFLSARKLWKSQRKHVKNKLSVEF